MVKRRRGENGGKGKKWRGVGEMKEEEDDDDNDDALVVERRRNEVKMMEGVSTSWHVSPFSSSSSFSSSFASSSSSLSSGRSR